MQKNRGILRQPPVSVSLAFVYPCAPAALLGFTSVIWFLGSYQVFQAAAAGPIFG